MLIFNGESRVQAIYIYTFNARLFYLLTQKLSEEQFPWIALDSFNEVPDWHESVLITTQDDLDKFHPVLNDINLLICSLMQPIEEIFLLLLHIIQHTGLPKKILIGIDPGMHETGLALIINDKYVYSEVTYTRAQFIERICLYFLIFPAPYKIIKIGNGYIRNTRYVLNYFFSSEFTEENVNFFLVNEKASSQSAHNLHHRALTPHEKAAIAIAFRFGDEVKKKLLLDYKKLRFQNLPSEEFSMNSATLRINIIPNLISIPMMPKMFI